eukprot:6177087-Ditylum_brightwellii.AAC.1
MQESANYSTSRPDEGMINATTIAGATQSPLSASSLILLSASLSSSSISSSSFLLPSLITSQTY